MLRVDCQISPFLHEPPNPNPSHPHNVTNFQHLVGSDGAPELDFASLIQALSLLCGLPVAPLLKWVGFMDPYEVFKIDDWIGPRRVSWFGAPASEPGSYTLSESDLDGLKELYRGIVGLDPDTRKKLQVPINRWISSVGLREQTDQMIDLGIALEALYLGGERSELGFKLAIRASWLLGHNKTERHKLLGIFRDIYKYRSDAVHQGTFMSRRGPEERDEVIKQAQDLCLRSIKKVIRQCQIPNWEILVLGD